MSDILDLDALVPPSVVIKFGAKEIEVKPPSLADVLKLGSLGQKMQSVGEMPDGDVDVVVSELTSHIYKCIPELENGTLNTAQLLKLVEIITAMSVPPDAKELEARGITTDSPKAQ
jgi:hypothetical protein